MTEADVIQPSASIASTGPGIRYIGNWAYAMSGMFGANSAAQTLIDTTTGSGLIDARITYAGPVRPEAPQSGSISAALITFNGVDVAILKNDGLNETAPTFSWIDIIIPPFTQIKITVESADTDPDNDCSIIIKGRVYGAD